ncbi:hypothetical protein BDW60DRAFT_180570 [Aspergillus nidulans var. acristatus]
MLFTSLFIGVASLAAQVSADTNQLSQSYGVPQRLIQGIRKMSDDAGEKFYMHYWHFEEDAVIANSTEKAQTKIDRSSVLPRSYHFQPPFSLGPERFADLRSSPLGRREFECPSGTSACTSINRSDSCCGTDETCVVVEDTGLGDVGCCPSGQDCSGTIGSCFEGYTSCPSSLGGGCCFPGYECVEGGCAHIITITITLSSTTLTTTSTEMVSATSTTDTSTTTTSTSTTTSTTTSTSSTGDLTPPDRPTSLSTSTSSETETTCPTGFYACAAVYQGGCCQIGRNCDTTSCPAISSTTIETEGRTIIIAEPTTSAATAASSQESAARTCATGWFSCADTVGGGCCPIGYACGASCTAAPTASTTGTVAKEAPTAESIGGAVKYNWKTLIWAMFMTLMML